MLQRTWRLYRESFRVLAADAEILWFPVVAAAATLAAGASFLIPMHRVGTLEVLSQGRAGWEEYALLFAFYYSVTAVILFFQGALVICANIRLSGGDPTVSDGLKVAYARLHRILGWALVAATAGVFFQALRGRRSRAGGVLGSIAGTAWSLVTFLILPVILFEDRGILDSVGRSADLFRKTWGEQVAGSFGFGVLNLLLALPALAMAFLIWPLDRPAAIIVATVYLLILAVVLAAMRSVFTVALYRYAASGEVPAGFTAEMIEGAFGKSRKVDET